MPNKQYQKQKRRLNYSKKRVDKAGRDIRHGCADDVRDESIAIIQNFREVHLYPLMLLKNHVARMAKKTSNSSIVSRRLKTLPTIINKLERPTLDGRTSNTIKLTGMQDIGGCRAVVSNIAELKELQERLEHSKSVHQITKIFDYLDPKESGYGGIHLIYNCFANSEGEKDWSNTKIEVQLRTELQHAWATSLEIIDTLEKVNLKTSMEGHKKWRRFFQLSGRLVAHAEGVVEFTALKRLEIITEILTLEEDLEVIAKLAQYKVAISVTTDRSLCPQRVLIHQGLILVSIKKRNEETGRFDVTVRTFGPKDTEKAFSELARNEGDEEILTAILVSAGNMRNLKKAYPNYFGSTSVFSTFLQKMREST